MRANAINRKGYDQRSQERARERVDSSIQRPEPRLLVPGKRRRRRSKQQGIMGRTVPCLRECHPPAPQSCSSASISLCAFPFSFFQCHRSPLFLNALHVCVPWFTPR